MKSRAPSCVKFMLWALSPESGEPWALGVHESCMIALCHVPSFLSLSVVYTFTRRTPYLVPLSEISDQSHMLRNGERCACANFSISTAATERGNSANLRPPAVAKFANSPAPAAVRGPLDAERRCEDGRCRWTLKSISARPSPLSTLASVLLIGFIHLICVPPLLSSRV